MYYAVIQDDGYFCEYAGEPPADGARSLGSGPNNGIPLVVGA
jgi:hypothetical protein